MDRHETGRKKLAGVFGGGNDSARVARPIPPVLRRCLGERHNRGQCRPARTWKADRELRAQRPPG